MKPARQCDEQGANWPPPQRVSEAMTACEESAIILKTCSKCGSVKRGEEFPDDVRTRCRDCDNARCREYYAANKAKIKARNRNYRASHRRKYVAYAKKYHADNREKHKAYSREYRKNNKVMIENLAIKHRLKGQSNSNPTPEEIEAYKIHLIFSRSKKELQTLGVINQIRNQIKNITT